MAASVANLWPKWHAKIYLNDLVVRVVQNEVLKRCVIPAKAGIQSPWVRAAKSGCRFRGHDTDVSEIPLNFE